METMLCLVLLQTAVLLTVFCTCCLGVFVDIANMLGVLTIIMPTGVKSMSGPVCLGKGGVRSQ